MIIKKLYFRVAGGITASYLWYYFFKLRSHEISLTPLASDGYSRCLVSMF